MVIFAIAGLSVASVFGREFLVVAAVLMFMGVLYNVPPIRTKDRPYIDVLSESLNNPLRLLLGWYATGVDLVIPVSLVMAYWMLGAFFMAIKRFAEYRTINDANLAAEYRKSFGHYTQDRLLVSAAYYAVAFGLFVGIFLIRYRVELILSLPFLAGFAAWYLHLGLKPDSPTQYPERLYQEKSFVAYAVLCLVIMIALMFIDIPKIADVVTPTLRVAGG